MYLGRTAPGLAVDRLCTVGDPGEELLAAAGPDGVVVLGDRRSRLGEQAGTTTLDVVDAAPDRTEAPEALLRRVPAAPTVVAVRPASGPLPEALALAARGAALAVVGLPSAGREDCAGVRLLAHPPCPVLLVTRERPRPGAAVPVSVSGRG
ncbi:MAG TPA: hypothetical protein VGH76_18145 [Actinomycetospora sp.]|jgi:hypothetical protein|uniref:hypothetical protein n=1 Tax=Actinomycetospora sp. TaxID=1872135 RepID=UPI002F412487